MIFRRKGDKNKYQFLDAKCIGRRCWAPGMYQHRSQTASGSRNTGSPDTACCMNRAYRGCPEGPDGEHLESCNVCQGAGGDSDNIVSGDPCFNCGGHGEITHVGLPIFDPKLAAERKSRGWKAAK